MKRYIALLLAIMLAATLFACSSKDGGDVDLTSYTETTETQSATVRITSTTALNEDGDKAAELEATIKAHFSAGNAVAQPDGSFVYENTRDAKTMYAYEREAELEQQASDNAEAFASAISEYYPYEITLEGFSAITVGSGDNGIDSVRYEAVYTNSQNQTMIIYVDSDAMISYIECTLTW